MLKLEKSPYLDHALTDCREIWHDYAFSHSAPCGPLKSIFFKIQVAVFKLLPRPLKLLLSAVYDSCQSPHTAFPHSIVTNAQQLTVVAHVNNPACQCLRYIVVAKLLLMLHL